MVSLQQRDVFETFNHGAMVGLLVVAVAIAMVMVISLLLVRRKPYGTISHGIVEVRRSAWSYPHAGFLTHQPCAQPRCGSEFRKKCPLVARFKYLYLGGEPP